MRRTPIWLALACAVVAAVVTGTNARAGAPGCQTRGNGTAAFEGDSRVALFQATPAGVVWTSDTGALDDAVLVAEDDQLRSVQAAIVAPGGRRALALAAGGALMDFGPTGAVPVAAAPSFGGAMAFDDGDVPFLLARTDDTVALLRGSDTPGAFTPAGQVTGTDPNLPPLALVVEGDGTVVGMIGSRPVTAGAGRLVVGDALLSSTINQTYVQAVVATRGAEGRAVFFVATQGFPDEPGYPDEPDRLHRLARGADGAFTDEVVAEHAFASRWALAAGGADHVVAGVEGFDFSQELHVYSRSGAGVWTDDVPDVVATAGLDVVAASSDGRQVIAGYPTRQLLTRGADAWTARPLDFLSYADCNGDGAPDNPVDDPRLPPRPDDGSAHQAAPPDDTGLPRAPHVDPGAAGCAAVRTAGDQAPWSGLAGLAGLAVVARRRR